MMRLGEEPVPMHCKELIVRIKMEDTESACVLRMSSKSKCVMVTELNVLRLTRFVLDVVVSNVFAKT